LFVVREKIHNNQSVLQIHHHHRSQGKISQSQIWSYDFSLGTNGVRFPLFCFCFFLKQKVFWNKACKTH
jgi:hypothetical protein